MSATSIGIVLLGAVLLVLLLVLERIDGGSIRPSSEAPGAYGFRLFSQQLNDGLRSQGAGFLAVRMEPRYVQCDASDETDIVREAVCDELGPQFVGFPVTTWQGAYNIHEFASVRLQLERLHKALVVEATDELGDGAFAVRAVDIDQGSGRYEAIIQAIVEETGFAGPGRVALVTSWRFLRGRWMMNHVLFAFNEPGDILTPNYQGRTYYPNWELFVAPRETNLAPRGDDGGPWGCKTLRGPFVLAEQTSEHLTSSKSARRFGRFLGFAALG